MKRTILTAYFEGVGFTMYDEVTTAINLEPLEAARFYLNLIKVDTAFFKGEPIEYKMECTHVRTDEVQEWDGKEWKDITGKEPFAVGTWKKYGNEFIHVAPYNVGGKVTRFN